MNRSRLSALIALSVCLMIGWGILLADEQNQPLPSPKAPGTIETGTRPSGLIAYISEGDVWIMQTDGSRRQKVCAVQNAKGRLSFSPDNSIIAFSRDGRDASKLPSGEGGMHVLHDIFLAYIDSASVNTNWWKRVTFGLGGFCPEWSSNDSIIYFQNDINANFVDFIVPSHQFAKVSIFDGHAEYLRKDWQSFSTSMLMPSVTRDGKKVAYMITYMPGEEEGQMVMNKYGIKILNMADIMKPQEEMRKPSSGLETGTSPSWSPDGQWLAYINNDMRNPGLFIVKADLSDKRLVFAPTGVQDIRPDPVGWAPNSKWLVFTTMDGTIYTIDINGKNMTAITGPGDHSNPTWSH